METISAMSGSLAPQVSLEDYRAAVERLDGARSEAVKRHQEAQSWADIEAGEDNIERLKLALDEFKKLRSGLTPRDLFIVEYKVTVMFDCEVSLVLPQGTSRMKLLQRAEEAAQQVYERSAVSPFWLSKWEQHEEFNARTLHAVPIAIHGRVEGTAFMERAAQTKHLASKGMEMPSLEDLAVAHAAYFLVVGEDLFRGAWIRARGGALYDATSGLSGIFIDDEDHGAGIAAAGCLGKTKP